MRKLWRRDGPYACAYAVACDRELAIENDAVVGIIWRMLGCEASVVCVHNKFHLLELVAQIRMSHRRTDVANTSVCVNLKRENSKRPSPASCTNLEVAGCY